MQFHGHNQKRLQAKSLDDGQPLASARLAEADAAAAIAVDVATGRMTTTHLQCLTGRLELTMLRTARAKGHALILCPKQGLSTQQTQEARSGVPSVTEGCEVEGPRSPLP